MPENNPFDLFAGLDDDAKEAMRLIKSATKSVTKDLKTVRTEIAALQKAQKGIVSQAQRLADALAKLKPELREDAEGIGAAAGAAAGAGKTFDALASAIKRLKKQEKLLKDGRQKLLASLKETIRLERQKQGLQAKLTKATSKEALEVEKLNQQLLEANKRRKENAREALGLVGAFQKESKKLIELRTRYKNVAIAQGEGSKAAKRLERQLTTLRAKIEGVSIKAGQSQVVVGRYERAMRGASGAARNLAAALGFTGVLFALISVFKQAFNIVKRYEKANAELAGVLGKTRKETVALQKDSARLGAITQRTATEVTRAQIAMARLGFTENEIIASTGAIIKGSIALNAELADTAQLTGAVVRAFDDLEASDAELILDKITKSTQISSNSFETLQTSLPKVAGAANALGFSLEKVLEDLSLIQDATQDASIAGTSLRRIYLELSKQGFTLDQALEQINTSQNKVNTAVKLFGVRAAVAALALANNRDRAKEVREELKELGVVEKVAAEQIDTLSGSLDLSTSAWEGLVLSVESGTGIISVGIRGLIDSFTGLVTVITEANEGTVSWGEAMIAVIKRTSGPIGLLNNLFGNTEKTINRLSQSAIKDLEELGVSAEQATKDVAVVTKKFGADAQVTEIQLTKLIETQKEQNRQTSIARQAQQFYNEAVERGADSFADFQKIFGTSIDRNINKTEIFAAVQGKFTKELQKQVDAIGEQIAAQKAASEQFDKDTEKRRKQFIESSKLVQGVRGPIQILEEELSKLQQRLALASTMNARLVIQGQINDLIKELEKLKDPKILQDIELLPPKVFEQAETRLGNFIKGVGKALNFLNSKMFLASQALVNGIGDLFTTLNEKQISANDQRIEALEEQREKEVEAAGSNAEARLAIERRFDSQIEKIEAKSRKRARENAIIGKALAIAEIIINTARSVLAALLPPPFGLGPVAGIPLAIAIGALGAVQVATVAATPIPSFAEGTMDAPAGPARVGEKGSEIHVSKRTGLARVIDQPALIDLEKGDQVWNQTMLGKGLDPMNSPDQVIQRNDRAAHSIREAHQGDIARATQLISHQMNMNAGNMFDAVERGLSGMVINTTYFDSQGNFNKAVKTGLDTQEHVASRNSHPYKGRPV